MNPSLKKVLLRTLSQLIADLKDPKEIEIFLQDFFSETELDNYAKRLAIIYWLKKGRDSQNIRRNLEASQKEIILARKLLTTPGIKIAIKNLEAEEWANVWAERIKKVVK